MKKSSILNNKNIQVEENAKSFWNWFDKNRNKYLFLTHVDAGEQRNLVHEFQYRLQKFNKNLQFLIGGQPNAQKVELIISAEGNTKHFEAVEHLVNSAPDFKDWIIIAFKPPFGEKFSINYYGREFSPENTIFIPLESVENPRSVGLCVYYSDYNVEEDKKFVLGTYLMLDGVLGERSCALDIDYLEVKATPDNIGDYNFMHLSNLADYIKEKKNEC